MVHFAAAETQRDAHLVAFFQKADDVADLDAQIVLVDGRAQLDLLDLDDLLLLARFMRLLLDFVTVFTVIEDFAYRGIGGGGDLYQVQAGLFSHPDAFQGSNNADHITILVDQSDGSGRDLAVDAGFVSFTHA